MVFGHPFVVNWIIAATHTHYFWISVSSTAGGLFLWHTVVRYKVKLKEMFPQLLGFRLIYSINNNWETCSLKNSSQTHVDKKYWHTPRVCQIPSGNRTEVFQFDSHWCINQAPSPVVSNLQHQEGHFSPSNEYWDKKSCVCVCVCVWGAGAGGG